MGLDRTDYVMFAVDIHDKDIDFWDDKHDGKYLPYIEGHEDCNFSIIDDYMCGEYTFFGRIIKKCQGYDGFDREPINISEFVVSTIKLQIVNEYYRLFGERILFEDIKLYCFTQWS